MRILRRLPGFRSDEPRVLLGLSLMLLIAAFALGGASRLNELRLALLEVLALPLLGVVLLRLIAGGGGQESLRLPLMLALATVAVPLIQIIPVPASVILGLPGREDLAIALQLTGVSPRWQTISVTPDLTWQAALALVPPLAMFGATLLGGLPLGRRAAHLTLALTFASLLLGAAQFAAGGDRLYLWLTTTPGHIVGFFANRNHLATLLLMSVPFVALFTAQAARAGKRDVAAGQRMWLWAAFLLLTIVAIGAIRSRAGVILLVPVLGASILCAWMAAGRGRPRTWLLAIGGGGAVVIAVAAIFALGPILERFEGASASTAGRLREWPVVLEAAEAYLPLGSGVGSFDAVFRSFEPLAHLDPTFFNHAHNEYLEILLEAGWPGIAVLAFFLIWYARRVWAVWVIGLASRFELQRAAAIAIGVVLTHSLADYPIRTELIAVIFALCCGILAQPAASGDSAYGGRKRRFSGASHAGSGGRPD